MALATTFSWTIFHKSNPVFGFVGKKKTLACGTIISNRVVFLSKKAQRGTIRWLRQGNVLFVKWMDSREVTMCSTIHKAYAGETVSRRVKNAEGEWRTQQIPIPTAGKEYNNYMGGVVLSNTLIRYYNVLQKTRKWYKTLFFYFFDIAVVNSLILHQEVSKAKKKKTMTEVIQRNLAQLVRNHLPLAFHSTTAWMQQAQRGPVFCVHPQLFQNMAPRWTHLNKHLSTCHLFDSEGIVNVSFHITCNIQSQDPSVDLLWSHCGLQAVVGSHDSYILTNNLKRVL